MPNLNLVSIAALIISALSLFLFVVEFSRHRSKTHQKELETLEKAEAKSYELIHDAIKKSQAILGQAELEEIKVVANSNLQTEKLEKNLEAQFAKTSAVAVTTFEQDLKVLTERISQAQYQYLKYLQDLKTRLDSAQVTNEEIVKTQVNNLFEKFEQNLTDFLTQTEQKTVMSIDLELQASRQLIETYKQQQLKIIDENIIAILEKTLSLVVARKLSLKDQSDMVFEALEKAKLEKFVA